MIFESAIDYETPCLLAFGVALILFLTMGLGSILRSYNMKKKTRRRLMGMIVMVIAISAVFTWMIYIVFTA
jgi:hypothetical protein